MQMSSTTRRRRQHLLWNGEDGIHAMARRLIERGMNTLMEDERSAFLQCRHHERSSERIGYRNGYSRRSLDTRHGRITLRVPRVRESSRPFRSLVFDRYRRRNRDIEDLIELLVADGLSTRQVGEVLAAAFGSLVSATTVSRVVEAIDAELRAFHDRDLSRGYRILWLDATYGHIRRKGKRGKPDRTCVLLSAWGMRHEGGEELVDFMACEGRESFENWTRFLSRLEARGLRRRNAWDMPLECAVADGDGSLDAALQTVYPGVPLQRCTFHAVQATAAHLRDRSNRKAFLAEAGDIYGNSRTREEACGRFRKWAARWREKEPEAVRCLESGFERTLTYFHLDPAIRKRVRTTNPIERYHKQLKGATRHAGAWAHLESWERHVHLVGRRLRESGYKPTLPKHLKEQFTQDS